MLKSNIFQV